MKTIEEMKEALKQHLRNDPAMRAINEMGEAIRDSLNNESNDEIRSWYFAFIMTEAEREKFFSFNVCTNKRCPMHERCGDNKLCVYAFIRGCYEPRNPKAPGAEAMAVGRPDSVDLADQKGANNNTA